MKLRLKSLTGLALAGFALVVLPLIAVLAAANIYVETLAEQSEQLIVQGVRLARQSKELEEKIIAMERNVRQYQVLGDYALIDLTTERYRELEAVLSSLEQSRGHAASDWHLDEIRSACLAILRALRDHPPQSAQLAGELERFSRLRELAASIRTQGYQFISAKSELLQATASDARRLLLLMAITLIPAVIVLSLWFTVLITRPINQLEQAIMGLGKGAFTEPIVVGGPHEIAALGSRLDWLRRRLTTLEAENNRFLRHMSHELKTPLSSIREGAELLLDGTVGGLSDTQREIADILRNNSLELQFLIENLLDYEQWREKSAELEISDFPLRPLLESTIRRHQLPIASKGLLIETAVEDFSLQADRERIRMTLDNLISNAVKFAPAGGTVYIKARKRPNSGERDLITIDIADTGPGIPAEERSRVFDPFYQGKSAGGGYLRGTGIGLSVVRDCIHAHRGTIQVIEGEYPGAHLRIQLPSPPAAR
ncbi:MAG: ATP-binding protein [Nevskiales bacterium]